MYVSPHARQAFGKSCITNAQSNLTTGCIAAAHERFSGIRQLAPVCTLPYTCFHGPTRVQIPNGILTGSAVFAQLTAECPYTLQRVILSSSLKTALSHEVIWTLIQYMAPWAHQSPQPKLHFDRFNHFCRAHDCDRQTDTPRCSV